MSGATSFKGDHLPVKENELLKAALLWMEKDRDDAKKKNYPVLRVKQKYIIQDIQVTKKNTDSLCASIQISSVNTIS